MYHMLSIILIYLAISAFMTCIITAACMIAGHPNRLGEGDKSTYSAPVLQAAEHFPEVQF
jgi:hypothetical protein